MTVYAVVTSSAFDGLVDNSQLMYTSSLGRYEKKCVFLLENCVALFFKINPFLCVFFSNDTLKYVLYQELKIATLEPNNKKIQEEFSQCFSRFTGKNITY